MNRVAVDMRMKKNSVLFCEPDHLPQRFGSRSVKLGPIGAVTLRDLEMHAIHEALQRHGGNKPAAAEELGVSLKTLYNKVNQASGLEKSA